MRGGVDWNGDPNCTDLHHYNLEGDGDFRSPECIELLKQADIVITNPPFSQFRDYFRQLIEHKKKFIVLGDQLAVTFKDVFPYIKGGLLWWGPSICSGDRWFEVPSSYPLLASSTKVITEGNVQRRFIKKKGVRWYTNLDHEHRHKDMILRKNIVQLSIKNTKTLKRLRYGRRRIFPKTMLVSWESR